MKRASIYNSRLDAIWLDVFNRRSIVIINGLISNTKKYCNFGNMKIIIQSFFSQTKIITLFDIKFRCKDKMNDDIANNRELYCKEDNVCINLL